MQNKVGLKYRYTDNGYCRVYYDWKNSKGQKVSYCAQDEGRGQVVFYRCTGGTWDEPEYQVKPKDAPPFSPGTEDTDIAVNQWIREKWDVEVVGA